MNEWACHSLVSGPLCSHQCAVARSFAWGCPRPASSAIIGCERHSKDQHAERSTAAAARHRDRAVVRFGEGPRLRDVRCWWSGLLHPPVQHLSRGPAPDRRRDARRLRRARSDGRPDDGQCAAALIGAAGERAIPNRGRRFKSRQMTLSEAKQRAVR